MRQDILHAHSEDQIRVLLKTHFGDQSFELKNIQPLTGGVLNSVIKVDVTVDSSFEQSFVIKTYSAKQLDPTAVASKEEIYNLQQLSAEHNGPVPKVSFFNKIDKHTRLVMDFIPGDLLKEVDEPKATELGATIANFHLSLQSFPGFKKKVSDARVLFNEVTESFSRALSTSSVLSEASYLSMIGRYAFKTLFYPSSAKLPGGIIHGDLHGGNIIVDKTGKLVILDFELCREDKYIKDIANAICMFCMQKDASNSRVIFDLNLVNKILSGYNSVRALTMDEIKYLPIALRDRSDLEMIANMKLALNKKEAGSPFDKSCAKALREALGSSAWSEFYTQYLNSFRQPSLISVRLPTEASSLMPRRSDRLAEIANYNTGRANECYGPRVVTTARRQGVR